MNMVDCEWCPSEATPRREDCTVCGGAGKRPACTHCGEDAQSHADTTLCRECDIELYLTDWDEWERHSTGMGR